MIACNVGYFLRDFNLIGDRINSNGVHTWGLTWVSIILLNIVSKLCHLDALLNLVPHYVDYLFTMATKHYTTEE